jgi:hypothetical protein
LLVGDPVPLGEPELFGDPEPLDDPFGDDSLGEPGDTARIT